MKRYLQKKLWDVMDYLQVKLPGVYRWIKKSFPRSIKQVILRSLTSATPELLYDEEDKKRLKKQGLKISFIFITNGKFNQNEVAGNYFRYTFYKKEIILVSEGDISYNGSLKFKRAKTLSEGIRQAAGDYLFIVGEGEKLWDLSVFNIGRIIRKTRADIFFGNFVDKNEELQRVYKSKLGHNFRDAVLPTGAVYGPKVISKEVIIRNRLPRDNENIFTYLLELSERTNKFVFIEKPFIKINKSQNELEKNISELFGFQKAALKRRFVYDDTIDFPLEIKKVLFVVPFLVKGGAEMVLFGLTKYFIENKIQVDIFCTHSNGAWVDKFKQAGARVFISGKEEDGEKIKELKDLCQKNEYDVIHMSNTDVGHNFLPVALELKKRPILIDTIHSQNNPLISFTQKYQAYLDKIIFVNNTARKAVENDFVAKNQLGTVYNGVELPPSSVLASDKERQKTPIITFLARLTEEKNPLQFIKIAARLAKEFPDWQYRVIGDGPLLKEMKYQAEKAGIINKVNFLGAVDGQKYLNDSTCYVLTSFTEGLPITILEALGSGVPVVTSEVGGTAEAVIDGKNGFLIKDPEDTEAYARRVAEIITGDYASFSNNARRSSEKFSYQNMGKQTLEVYQEVLAEIPKKFDKMTTIAMLSFNRTEEIKKTIETIYENTKIPFKLLILDNHSEEDTRKFLRKLEKEKDNVEVIFEDVNLGCPKGRRKMLERVNSDYIVTIDNDMEVPLHWLRDLILRLEEDKKIMGVCVKDIFPWGKVEFTGGKIDKDEKGFALFNSTFYRKDYDDLTTLEEFNCDWIPGGATLWRGNIKEIAEHHKAYINAFEDFDYSLQITSKGYKIVNCPSVMFIHNHASGYDKKRQQKEAKYLKDRNDEKGFLISMAVFYKRTGYVMRNDKLFGMFGFGVDVTPEDVKKVLVKEGPNVKPIK